MTADVTKGAAWAQLAELNDAFTPDLRGWFAADPDRAARFTRTAGDLYVDLSKSYLTDEVPRAVRSRAEPPSAA